MAESDKACSTSSQKAIHLLPCSINYTGPAKATSYFRPVATVAGALVTGQIVDGTAVLEATFRGRHLRGTELQLPCGFAGYVLEPEAGQPQPALPGARPALKEAGRFHSFTYWNHDTDPVGTDAVRRALSWLPLAAEVHRPVPASEVDAFLQHQKSAEGRAEGS